MLVVQHLPTAADDLQINSKCSARHDEPRAPYSNLVDPLTCLYARRGARAPIDTGDGAVDTTMGTVHNLAAHLWYIGERAGK